MYYLVYEKIFNTSIFTDYKENEEDNITKLMIAYGKYRIIKNIFVEEKPGLVVKINDNNYKKFIYILKQLESFHLKCKNYI